MKSRFLSSLAALLVIMSAGQGAFAMRNNGDYGRRVPRINFGVVRARNAGQVVNIGDDVLELEYIPRGTPLIDAANSGNGWRVHDLLTSGANPNVRDNYEETPLSIAMRRGDANMTIELLEAGADPTLHINPSNPNSQTPLEMFNAGEYNFGDRTDEVRAHLIAGGAGILSHVIYPRDQRSISAEEMQ